MKNEMKIFESLEFGRIRTVSEEKGLAVVLLGGCVRGVGAEARRCMPTVGKGVGFNPTPFDKRWNADG